MAMYNILIADLSCPHCQRQSRTPVNIYFGFCNLLQYQMGDRVQWVPRKQPQNGGRPPNGDLDSEGYAECAVCHQDYFVRVSVRADALVDARPDLSRLTAKP